MAWGSGGSGSVPYGSTAAAVGPPPPVPPDPSIEPFEFLRRTKPFEFLRRTKPFEMKRGSR